LPAREDWSESGFRFRVEHSGDRNYSGIKTINNARNLCISECTQFARPKDIARFLAR